MNYNQIILIVYLVVLLIMSFYAFFMYGKDKKMSKSGTNVRVKEKTLLFGAVFGGAIGSWLGRIVFRHKTNKVYFSLIIYLSLLLEIGVAVLLGYLAFNGGVINV